MFVDIKFTRRSFFRAAGLAAQGLESTGVVAGLLWEGGSGLLCDTMQKRSLFGEGGEYGVFLQQLDSLNGATTLQELALGAEQCARAGNSVAGALGRLLIAPSIRGALGEISAAMTRNDGEKAVQLMRDLFGQVGDPDAACMLFQLAGQLSSADTLLEQVSRLRIHIRYIITRKTSALAMKIDSSRANAFTQNELPRRLADADRYRAAERRGQLLEGLGRSLANQLGRGDELCKLNLPEPLKYLVTEVTGGKASGGFAHYEFLRIPERVSP
jgi:hypothetical protein